MSVGAIRQMLGQVRQWEDQVPPALLKEILDLAKSISSVPEALEVDDGSYSFRGQASDLVFELKRVDRPAVAFVIVNGLSEIELGVLAFRGTISGDSEQSCYGFLEPQSRQVVMRTIIR